MRGLVVIKEALQAKTRKGFGVVGGLSKVDIIRFVCVLTLGSEVGKGSHHWPPGQDKDDTHTIVTSTIA